MAKIHLESGDTVHTSLDLFKVPSTEMSEFEEQSMIVNPIRSLTGDQIEHVIAPSDEHYTDLSKSYYVIDLRVVKHDGYDLAATNNLEVWPGDNFIHSLFASASVASVELTNSPIEFIGQYSHNSFMAKLTKKSIKAKKGRLSASRWFQGGAVCKDSGKAQNAAVTKKKAMISESKTVSMIFVPDSASF